MCWKAKAVYRLNQDWVEVESWRFHVASSLLPSSLLCWRAWKVPLSAVQGCQPAHEAVRSGHDFNCNQANG